MTCPRPLSIAVLGNAGSWYVADLQRAAADRGDSLTRMDFPPLAACVGRSTNDLRHHADAVSGPNLLTFDAVIVRTMPPASLEQVVFRMDALLRLEMAGVTVLNPPKAIECAVDKYLTTMRLQAAGLPVPETVVCEQSDVALEAFARLGGDVVVKPLFGSEGRGIVRVSDPDLALRTFRTLERLQAVLYLQRFVPHAGYDVRVMVLDGRILGGMKRRSTTDFRTNVARQARTEAHDLTDQEADYARRAATVSGARFAGVDLLYDRSGDCYVIEVNAVPGWKAFARTTGLDVAAEVIETLHQEQRHA